MPRVTIDRPTKSERPKIQKVNPTDPVFETVLEDDGIDPLVDVDFDSTDPEGSAEREISEIARQIQEEKKASYERFRIAYDPDYYMVLCFQSRDQRDEFLAQAGWAEPGTRFVNGLDVARRLNLDVNPIPLDPPKRRGRAHLYKRNEVL